MSTESKSVVGNKTDFPGEDDNSSIDIDEELSRLGLETLDNFVYDALGSFDRPILNKSGESVSNISPHSADVIKLSGNSTQESREKRGSSLQNVTPHPSHQSDSGISSAATDTTSPKVLVLIDPSASSVLSDPAMPVTAEKAKIQPNGTATGKAGPSAKPLRSQASEASTHGKGNMIDAGILRMELTVAVEQNKVDKVRRILNSGIDANSVCDEKGRWPLHIAAFLGHATLVKLLLEFGAQKDQPDTALERTPLLYAAATSPEIVQILLNYRADIHSKNKFGATALHYAAGAGQAECCRLLTTAGCDVNSRDRQKMTPLHMAARVDDIRSIETLLEYGADIHAKDSLGKCCDTEEQWPR